ncbi:pyridoxal-phosphate dependent enzyme [Streptomyces oceani]|uniref:Cysteine synthase n=1 Tax=Streptomyces oceani TaxID=1075402 RepID=A0A1E7KKC7_9ACTN|nr:pyridoxal-phosphate dependent enzyme [Streptomyces oceani]OEV04395.1 cysteine synthase [Streptomyces oceani]
MHDHIAEVVKQPALVTVRPELICLRFEILKVPSALGAVRRLLDSGTVRAGDTLVDSSSGIYALALALACHRYDMRCHIVGSTTVDPTLRVQLEALGATLEQVDPSRSLRLDQGERVRRITRLIERNPSYHWMRQYHDDIHYLGYREVAETIAREIPTGPLSLTGGVGTGASTGAIATRLREQGRDVRLVGVQPFGSVTFGAEHITDPDMIIAGIGSAIEFRNVRHRLYDQLHWLDFEHAMAGAVGLLRDSGVFAGLSSGASYLAARWEQERDHARTHLFVAADTGHRYVEQVYARHAEALDIDTLKPHEVTGPRELSAPWSTAPWR